MTRDDFLKLEAGRELDALVAEKVMGLTADKEHCPYCGAEMWIGALRNRCTQCGEWRYGYFKDYSTDIAAAWEVVEKMAKVPFAWHFETVNVADGVRWWVLYWGDGDDGEIKHYSVQAPTAPLAICRAALLAVTVEP